MLTQLSVPQYAVITGQQTEASLKEKIDLLEGMLDDRVQSQIIVTGKSPMVQRLFKALPQPLKKVSHRHFVDTEDAALSAVIHAEGFRFSKENQKWPSVTQLRRAVWRNGLATAGFAETSAALGCLPVDTILIAKEQATTSAVRGLVGEAHQHGVGVNVIDDSHTLLALGGVGALLRRLPKLHEAQTLDETASVLTALTFNASIL